MNKIEKIRAEVERRIKMYREASDSGYNIDPNRIDEDEGLLSFINSLQQELPSELDEAAKDYSMDMGFGRVGPVQRGFKAGAEWDRQQMLKEAMKGEVYLFHSYNRDATAILVDIPKENLGDKVRVIIVKEDEK